MGILVGAVKVTGLTTSEVPGLAVCGCFLEASLSDRTALSTEGFFLDAEMRLRIGL